MDLIEIDIEPRNKIILLTSASIWVRQIKLFEFAIIEVRLKDSSDKTWDTHTFKIEGFEYLEWNSDQYLIDWVKSKIRNIN
jgi:hypothetical protein